MTVPRLWIDGPESRDKPPRGRAAALVAAFAERHVVLTPELAVALAAIEAAEAPAEAPVWGQAFRLAGQAVGQERVVGRSRFWRGAVPAFHGLVAEPVLRRAMAACDGAGLAGAADLPPARERPRPGRWQERLDDIVRRLLSDPEAMGRGFWIETAVRLLAAAWRDAQSRAGHLPRRPGLHAVAPEADPLLCRLLFEAEPEFPESFRVASRRIRARQKSQRKRAGHRPKEGGVSGIRTSTILDDLPDALVSELVLPSRLVVDRLLHEGLIVRHRPPYRQPKRDLLVLGLADRRADGPAGAIAKAAWADAAIRLQILLGQMGLPLSDLVWSEARATGLAADLLRVEDAEASVGLDPILLRGPLRAARLFRSGLMPGFPDTTGATDPLPADSEGLRDMVPHLARSGLRRLQIRHRIGGGRLGPGADIAHRPADYARRIAIVVLPAGSDLALRARADWTSVRGQFSATLARVMEEETRLIALLPPREVVPGAAFSVVGGLIPDGTVAAAFEPDAPAAEAVNRVLGRLSATMISAVLRALDAG